MVGLNEAMQAGAMFESHQGRPPLPGCVQFGHVNLAAGLTAHQINFGGIATVDGAVPFVAPRAGRFSFLSAGLSEAAAGATLTVLLYKNGASVASIDLVAGATGQTAEFRTESSPQLTFAAGDQIDVRVTTPGGWSAATADLGVAVGFILNADG